MDEPSSRYFHVNVDSAVSSGLAAVLFDVLLLAVIRVQSQALCSIANVFLVYDKRRPLKPTQSRLGFLTGGPVGPRNLSRLFSVLIAIVTGCVIVLGFSINGKTVATYKPEIYQSLVAVTYKPANFDFANEVEVLGDGEFLVSQQIVALADSIVCLRNDYDYSFVYAYAFKDTRIDKTKLQKERRDHQFKKIKGGVCVDGQRFKEPKINREYGLDGHGSPVGCPIKITKFELETQPDGRKYGKVDIDDTDCDVDLRGQMQCFELDGRTSCAGMGVGDKIRNQNVSQGYMVRIESLDSGQTKIEEPQIVEVAMAESLSDEAPIALNVAFLSTLGIGGWISNVANLAISEIQYDQLLYRNVGTHEISEVDLRMAKPLVWVVVSLTVVLMIAMVYLWVVVIYSKGRGKYNTFSTVSEVLQLAASKQMQRTRQTYEHQPYVGISASNPKIVVVGRDETEEITNARWTEPEIGGPGDLMEGERRLGDDDDFDGFVEDSFPRDEYYV